MHTTACEREVANFFSARVERSKRKHPLKKNWSPFGLITHQFTDRARLTRRERTNSTQRAHIHVRKQHTIAVSEVSMCSFFPTCARGCFDLCRTPCASTRHALSQSVFVLNKALTSVSPSDTHTTILFEPSRRHQRRLLTDAPRDQNLRQQPAVTWNPV